MKRQLLTLAIVCFGITSCLKSKSYDCVPVTVNIKAPDTEISSLKGILAGSGVTVTEDPRGFFYNITTAGSGPKPTTCSTITVGYTAALLNGIVADSSSNAEFPLGGLITGWQEALPLLSQGGVMTLYLPPALGYGYTGNRNIPANSNLKFVISLKKVN